LDDDESSLCKSCPKCRLIDKYEDGDEDVLIKIYSCVDKAGGGREARENCINSEIAKRYKQAWLDHCIKVRANMIESIKKMEADIEKYSKLVT
jgi:hypothetical protein